MLGTRGGYEMTADEIRQLYKDGGFLAKSIWGDWWRYVRGHKPGMAQIIKTPHEMIESGELAFDGRDHFAKVTYYKLVEKETSANA